MVSIDMQQLLFSILAASILNTGEKYLWQFTNNVSVTYFADYCMDPEEMPIEFIDFI